MGGRLLYVRREKSWLKHIDFAVLDIFCIIVTFYIGYIFRHGIGSDFTTYYWRLLCILVVLDISVSLIRSSHKSIVRRSYLREMLDTVTHCVTVDGLALFFLFLVQETGIYSRESLLIYFVLHNIATYVARCLHKHALRKKMTSNPDVEQMLILTNREGAEQCVRELSQDEYRNYQVVGVVLMDDIYEEENTPQESELNPAVKEAAATEEIAGVPVVSNYNGVRDYLMEHVVDSVFLNLQLDSKKSRRLNNELIRAGVTVHINLVRVPDDIPNRTVERLGNYTVLTTGLRLASARQIMMKRLLDIAGGLVGSLLTVLVSVFIGPFIYFQSPGPIYFKQKRVGKNGRTFEIYKFRSMYMDAEERKKELMQQNEMDGLMFKMKDDPRIIPIGHFIRKYSIDELPQFFNVLKGDMSIVGTRPPTVDEYEQYQVHHRGRLASKPGITGLWQVSGRNQITDFEEIVELDTDYIMRWSVVEDIRIILKTVSLVIHGDGE
ncbi:sugar transferase [Clostridium sp. OM07-10AC]|nr:sugar transferase [Clostridium sp. OM07-9AC]RHV03772.1 sugar transferase [Clostridium sp. OM07-10AC]